jgi:hypothetical protein
MRKSHSEHFSTAVPQKADIARRGSHGRKVPLTTECGAANLPQGVQILCARRRYCVRGHWRWRLGLPSGRDVGDNSAGEDRGAAHEPDRHVATGVAPLVLTSAREETVYELIECLIPLKIHGVATLRYEINLGGRHDAGEHLR